MYQSVVVYEVEFQRMNGLFSERKYIMTREPDAVQNIVTPCNRQKVYSGVEVLPPRRPK